MADSTDQSTASESSDCALNAEAVNQLFEKFSRMTTINLKMFGKKFSEAVAFEDDVKEKLKDVCKESYEKKASMQLEKESYRQRLEDVSKNLKS